MDIFRGPNRLFDLVSDAEFHDIKNFAGFPGKPILEISLKNRDCVGHTNICRCSLMNVCLISIHNCPVNFRMLFSGCLFDFERTYAILTPV